MGAAVDGDVQLSWSTMTETNNYGWYVERRGEKDATFVELTNSFVPGAGSTLEEHQYSWVDENVAPDTYIYRLRQVDLNGDVSYSHEIRVVTGALGVPTDGQSPKEFSLHQNYPNPFNPATTIKYGIPERSRVIIEVYNMLGQKIATLVNTEQDAGYKSVAFDVGVASLPSGVYLYRLTATSVADPARSFQEVRKMMFIK